MGYVPSSRRMRRTKAPLGVLAEKLSPLSLPGFDIAVAAHFSQAIADQTLVLAEVVHLAPV